MIKTVKQVHQELMSAKTEADEKKIIRDYGRSIVDECAVVCMTDDVIREDILKLKSEIK